MWDLPGPGLEPMSPALAGRFLTTAPPGKSSVGFLFISASNNFRAGVMCVIVVTPGLSACCPLASRAKGPTLDSKELLQAGLPSSFSSLLCFFRPLKYWPEFVLESN